MNRAYKNRLLYSFLLTLCFTLRLTAQPDWYNDYDIKYYKIDINANDTTTFLSGNTTIIAEIIKNPLDSFRLELNPALIIDSIKYNNQNISFYRTGDIISIPITGLSLPDQFFEVTVYYYGLINSIGKLSYISSKIDNTWNIPVTWTLSEPYGAKIWFPCKQYLPDKADSVDVFITVPKNLKAGSNGKLIKITPVGNEQYRYEWKTKYPTAYYLISFTVADYSEYSYYAKIFADDSVFFQNYIYNRPDYLNINKNNIDQTVHFLRLFSKKFGMYPFKDEKYGHCVAPMGGGMEHQTMTTLSDFNFTLVSHELAHQWFGDLITCSTWQDIWINEGFASYSEYIAIDSLMAHADAVNWMKTAHKAAFTYPEGSVYVPIEEITNESRIFNYGLSYKKGATIIHMLRNELANDDTFFLIINKFLHDFAFKTATGADFLTTVNSVTKKDFTWFFDQWYYGKGFPQYDFSWKQTNDTLFLTSFQTPSYELSDVFRMYFDIKVYFDAGDTIIRLCQDQFNKLFTLHLNKRVASIEINPEYTALMKVLNVNQVPDLPSIDDNISVLPNPFSDYLKINFNKPPVGEYQLKLISINGGVTKTQKNIRKPEIKLETKDCKGGIYLLYITDKQNKYIRKVIKLE